MRLRKDVFKRELRYQVIMYLIKKMLLAELISDDNYYRIDEWNLQRYKPITGNLLSGKYLLRKEIRIQKTDLYVDTGEITYPHRHVSIIINN